MNSIYQISNELTALTTAIIEQGGEFTDEQLEALQLTEQNLKTKAVNYGYVIKQMDFECSQIDEEVKRLQELKKYRQNALKRLKTILSEAMQRFEIDEVATPTLKVNFRKSQVLEVTDEKQIDETYKLQLITTKVDKVGIKKALKQGLKVDGVELITKQNIQIK